MPILRRLPDPTWSGVPDDVVQQFAAFMAEDAQRRHRLIPDELRDEMERAERQLRTHRENKTALERSVQPLQAKRRRLERQLADRKVKTDEALLEQMELIKAIPFVKGTRVDETGRLVILMRLQLTQLGKVRDMGDLELVLEAKLYDRRTPMWKYLVRVIRDVSTDEIYGFNRDYNYESRGDTYEGYTDNFRDPKDYIGTWQFAELVNAVAQYLITENLLDEAGLDEEDMHNEDHATFPVLFGEPDTIWEGFLLDPLKALRRSIELHPSTIEYRLQEVKKDLGEKVYKLELAKAGVREWDTKARRARAAYEAQRVPGADQIVIQFEDVVSTIVSIMQFPGVMGIRFSENGTPVVHVRSTLAYHGKLFDGGDFEIRLARDTHRPGQGGMWTKHTRIDSRADGRKYRHYDHHDHDWRYAWFCYGDRSPEIERLISEGSYAAAVHLSINTLNSLNEGDQSERYLTAYYPRIVKNLVWRSAVQVNPVEPAQAVA